MGGRPFGREGPYQHLSGGSHDAVAAAIAASTLNHRRGSGRMNVARP
jgi:hypothetical protein